MPRLETLVGALSLLLCCYGTLAASVHYCHVETSEEEPIPFCVAVSTWANASTYATDLIVTFGYKRTYDRGWGAVGLGERMYPSLIFMTYGLQVPGQELIVSIRDGREYREPRPSPDLPKLHKIRESFDNTSRWIETTFMCYGCEDWAAQKRGSMVQPWIWAFNEQDDVENPTVESEVWFHSYTGLFSLDMTDSAATAVAGRPAIPSADPNHPSQNFTSTVNIYSSLVPVHGSLLGLAMLVLYPCGLISIRTLPTKARLYLFFQIVGSISCAIGATAMIYAIILNDWVNLFQEPHALLGMAVLLLLIPQLSLGYLRQKSLTSSQTSKTAKNSHAWLGRAILAGGCANTVFGLQLAGFSTSVLLAASAVAALDLFMIAFLPRILHKRDEDLTSRSPGDEDAVPLLENGLELK